MLIIPFKTDKIEGLFLKLPMEEDLPKGDWYLLGYIKDVYGNVNKTRVLFNEPPIMGGVIRDSLSSFHYLLQEKEVDRNDDWIVLIKGVEKRNKQIPKKGSGLLDCLGKEICEGDTYKTIWNLHDVNTVFLKGGAFCGGKDFENAYPLGWDVIRDTLTMVADLSWIIIVNEE